MILTGFLGEMFLIQSTGSMLWWTASGRRWRRTERINRVMFDPLDRNARYGLNIIADWSYPRRQCRRPSQAPYEANTISQALALIPRFKTYCTQVSQAHSIILRHTCTVRALDGYALTSAYIPFPPSRSFISAYRPFNPSAMNNCIESSSPTSPKNLLAMHTCSVV